MDNPVLLDESPEYEIITGAFVARTLTISCNLQNNPAAPPQWKSIEWLGWVLQTPSVAPLLPQNSRGEAFSKPINLSDERQIAQSKQMDK